MTIRNFEITVTHNGKTTAFPGKLQQWGYGHKIEVSAGVHTLVFEPDEEGEYRVLIPDTDMLPDRALVKAIAESITAALK
jgi:hypothetical protein